LARALQLEKVDEGDPNHRDERTRVTVLELVFERGTRKWQFVWNGIKISAPIKHDEFLQSWSRENTSSRKETFLMLRSGYFNPLIQ
jgi:hypothetical protein